MLAGARPVGVADGGGGGGGGGELRLDADSRAALDRFGAAAAAVAGSPAAHTTDKIIFGKAPDERGVRRPEHFAAIDIAPFERHEAAIGRLSSLTGEAFGSSRGHPPRLRLFNSTAAYGRYDQAICDKGS